MRAQYDLRLAHLESRNRHSRRCAFSNEESLAINEIFRKYLGGRDPTRADIRARGSVAYSLTDEEFTIVNDAVRAAVIRGNAPHGESI